MNPTITISFCFKCSPASTAWPAQDARHSTHHAPRSAWCKVRTQNACFDAALLLCICLWPISYSIFHMPGIIFAHTVSCTRVSSVCWNKSGCCLQAEYWREDAQPASWYVYAAMRKKTCDNTDVMSGFFRARLDAISLLQVQTSGWCGC